VASPGARCGRDLTDVVLAIDVSGSMRENDPERRRVDAARAFLALAEATPTNSASADCKPRDARLGKCFIMLTTYTFP